MTEPQRVLRTPWRTIHLAGATWACLCMLAVVAGGPIWDVVGQHGELHGVYVAKYEAAARGLGELRLPLWNPWEFAGIPLFGTAHGAMLYPPVVASFALLAPRTALQALYVAHAGLLAWACTAYLARIGLGVWLGGLAALVALAALMNGVAGVGIDHPPILMCLAWVPVQLLCWEEALHGRAGRWTAALAAAVAAQWLAGYPQFLPDTAVLLGVVALVGSRGAPPLTVRLRVLVAGFALGTALTAIYVLPVVEVGEQSMRTAAPEAVQSQRAGFRVDSPSDLASLTPYDARTIPALLAALAAFLAPDRRRLAWLVAFVWAVFPVNFPFSLLYELPPLRLVRNPFEWAYLSALFLGFLTVAGIDTLLAGERRIVRMHAGGSSVRAAGVLAAVAVLLSASHAAVTRDPASMRRGGAPRYAELAKRASIFRALGRELRTDARLVSFEDLRAESPLRHGLRSILGFEPALRPRRIDRLLRELELGHAKMLYGESNPWATIARRPALAALLGIGFVVTRPRNRAEFREAGFEQVATLGREIVLFRRPLPRVRVVHEVRRAADEEEALALLLEDSEASLTRPVVDDEAGPLTLEPPPARVFEPAFTIVDEPEHVEIDVTLASPGLLVLMDNWFPGWEAEVDGRPARLLRVDYTFRGVALPAGRHRVSFRYRPFSVRAGAMVSGVALLVLVALVWRGGGTRRAPA